MGAITTALGIGIGMTGAGGRSGIIFGPREPRSFDESLGIGIVVGFIVFLLYTFNKWPYFQDIWGRPPKGER
jgi:hypothetical protein